MFRHLKNWFLHNILKRPIMGVWEEHDVRNLSAAKILGKALREDITEKEFCTCHFDELIHQKSSDFCIGCSGAYAKEATEGRKMSWAGAYALACKILGYIPSFGMSILAMMKARVKYGIPELRLWPYTGRKSHDADWRKMPQKVLDNAKLYRDKSFAQIYGVADMTRFDQFRAYLNRHKDKKIVIQTGVDGHAVTLIGQKRHPETGEICLYGPDSYGNWNHNYRWGPCINGYRYFNKEDANYLFYGMVAFDIPRLLAELLNELDGKAIKLQSSGDCYLVKAGEKHLMKNEAIAWSHNTLLFGENNVISLTEDEFNLIPDGRPAVFGEGQNHEIVRRILEKTEKANLIDEE